MGDPSKSCYASVLCGIITVCGQCMQKAYIDTCARSGYTVVCRDTDGLYIGFNPAKRRQLSMRLLSKENNNKTSRPFIW